MLRDEKSPVKTEEDLKDSNRRIVKLGETLNKPGLRHLRCTFLKPPRMRYTAESSWRVRASDADQQAPLYLRTTEEMLKEFSTWARTRQRRWSSPTPARSRICARKLPVRPDKCPPVIENSDETLRKICYDQAHEMYGEDLPELFRRVWKGVKLHYFQRIRRDVYHRPETGLEVQ